MNRNAHSHRLQLTALLAIATPAAANTINAGTTTVTSIGHQFLAVNPSIGVENPTTSDFLIQQSQELGGGGALPNVSLDLDQGTAVSYTIAAPANMKFLVNLPAGERALLFVNMGYEAPAGDRHASAPGAPIGVSFSDYSGPSLPWPGGAFVGDANQIVLFQANSSLFSGTLSFTSVTFTATYSERNLGPGALDYTPVGGGVIGTSSFGPLLGITYSDSSLTSDPGRFVSIVPDTPAMPLPSSRYAGAMFLALVALRQRRRTPNELPPTA